MQKKGFTLLEVLIVVIILVSVSMFAVPAYRKMQVRSKYNAALGTLIQFGSGVKMLRDASTAATWNSNPVKLASSWFSEANVSAAAEKAPKDITPEQPNIFKASLVAHGYMVEPRLSGGYDFYLCNPSNNYTQCCIANAIACMQAQEETSLNTDFRKVVFCRNGSYKRTTDTNACD